MPAVFSFPLLLALIQGHQHQCGSPESQPCWESPFRWLWYFIGIPYVPSWPQGVPRGRKVSLLSSGDLRFECWQSPISAVPHKKKAIGFQSWARDQDTHVRLSHAGQATFGLGKTLPVPGLSPHFRPGLEEDRVATQAWGKPGMSACPVSRVATR